MPDTTPALPTRPTAPGEWSVTQIEQALSRRLPNEMVKIKTVDGKKVGYLPWYTVCDILDKYAPGWRWEIVSTTIAPGFTVQRTNRNGEARTIESMGRLVLVGRLTIPTSHGPISRDATGCEDLLVAGYGDPSSNAESMAFRRAAAKFGLARYLYSEGKK